MTAFTPWSSLSGVALIFLAAIAGGIAFTRLFRQRTRQTDGGIRKPRIRKLDGRFSVTGQIRPEQIAAVAAEGYRLIVCNRPDGEGPGQPTFAEIAAAAKKENIATVYIPMAGPPTARQIAILRTAMTKADGPALGYCRSGARSQRLYAASKS